MSVNSPRSATALFVSPHFDDVALSCGGTTALAARDRGAHVITVFAGEAIGDINEFARFQHRRWGAGGDVVDERRREDIVALGRLGASHQWLDFPDAIYRERLYLSDEELFGEVCVEDLGVAMAVVDSLVSLAATFPSTTIYLPLAVGGHVDHRICQMAARPLRDAGHRVSLYEDFPYAATPGAVEHAVGSVDLSLEPFTLDVTDVLDARLSAIDAYTSQLPTIFRHHGPVGEVIRAYAGLRSNVDGRYAEGFWKVT